MSDSYYYGSSDTSWYSSSYYSSSSSYYPSSSSSYYSSSSSYYPSSSSSYYSSSAYTSFGGSSSGDLLIEDFYSSSNEEIQQAFDFDPNGPSEVQNALLNPFDAYKVGNLAGVAEELAKILFPGPQGDNAADAFRHAYWNFMMAQAIGVDGAKAFADSHERNGTIFDSSSAMDLFNNDFGRDLFEQNPDGNAIQLIVAAINNGDVVTSPGS